MRAAALVRGGRVPARAAIGPPAAADPPLPRPAGAEAPGHTLPPPAPGAALRLRLRLTGHRRTASLHKETRRFAGQGCACRASTLRLVGVQVPSPLSRLAFCTARAAKGVGAARGWPPELGTTRCILVLLKDGRAGCACKCPMSQVSARSTEQRRGWTTCEHCSSGGC